VSSAGSASRDGQSRAAPATLVVTGASGVGKTTLVDAVDATRLRGVACYHFDALGVPGPEETARRFGGGQQWREWAMREWAARLARNEDRVAVAVLDAQVPPTLAGAALRAAGMRRVRVVLVDCGHAARNARLRGPRGQPELACAEMDCWAAYLRGQADALGLAVIDTNGGVGEAAAELLAHVRALAPQPAARRKHRDRAV
jgi:hypothetical protein